MGKNQLLKVIQELRSDLFYQIEAKHGAKKASEYPSIVKADELLKSKEDDSLYKLYENNIYVTGSHRVIINEKIFQEELFEYTIIDRKDFIDELISWISECGYKEKRSSDKTLMKEDLEMLMNIKDDYMFSSVSTNKYVGKEDSNFNELCEELISLNNSLL